MKTFTVVGYAFNADTFCESCADELGITDEPPIFADSEFDYQPTCGYCFRDIPYVTVLQD